jgi:hypothetical protein
MIRKVRAVILAGAVLTLACSDDAITVIDSSWVGNYHLLSVDSKAPPQSISAPGSDVDVKLKAISLSFGLTGWNETDTYVDTPTGGTPQTRTVESSGTAQRSGSKLTFYASDGSVYSATMGGGQMVFSILVTGAPHTYALIKDP